MSLDDLNVDLQVQKMPIDINRYLHFLFKIMIGKLLKTVLIVKESNTSERNIGNYYNYRSEMVNLNTVNSKFHLIQSFLEYLARFLSFHV